MAGDMVDVVQKCSLCETEVGTFSVKKENCMLISSETVWCPECQANTPELRDVAGRFASIEEERASLPSTSYG